MSSPRAAKGNQEEAAPTAALKMGNTAVTALAKLIPESVPRPVAKTAVTVTLLGGGFLAFKAMFSAIFSFVLIVAVGITLLALGGGGDAGDDEGGDDALDEARKIMDKYK